MPRKKNYVDPHRLDPSTEEVAAKTPLTPTPDPAGALVDLRAEAPDARFTGAKYHVDLRSGLAKGVDEWIWACVACIKAMLHSGSFETSTLTSSGPALQKFFEFLTLNRASPLASGPSQLKPIHTAEFVSWLKARVAAKEFTQDTARQYYNGVKRVLTEMMEQGFLVGNKSKLFPRGAVKRGGKQSRQVSFSVGEQERLANAIKSDLSRVHKGTLSLLASETQALRFLLVSHRQGFNLTPLLEMRRKGMRPGVQPGTVLMYTSKVRGRSIRGRVGRASIPRTTDEPEEGEPIPFPMAEGAVIQQAIESTKHLVPLAPENLKDRIWLYLSQSSRDKDGIVTVLTPQTLAWCIQRVVDRHSLSADDGKVLRINSSRLRKSFWDRAWLQTGGSVPFTANLMGNTATVAATRYPSVNAQLQADAANYLHGEQIEKLRANGSGSASEGAPKPVIPLVLAVDDNAESKGLDQTPVSRCQDPANGRHAPGNGSLCSRFIMCIFCSSFAIVGTEVDLWKIFSFQVFAKTELAFLDEKLGVERTTDEVIEDLRDRYRIAIPYITSFTDQQFSSVLVQRARRKTQELLHPFWLLQMKNSERARSQSKE